MKAWRKGWILFLVVILAGGLLACSSKEATDTDSKDKKYTITSLDFLYTDIPPKDGKGIKMIEKRFNVDYKREYGIYTDYKEKLTSRVASGDIPDVMGFTMEEDKANYFKWAKQGAFLPLNEYIDEYPSLKRVPKEVWNSVSIDGKIYAIPRYFPKNYLNSPIIRKDWLDKLGLEMPTNYDELKKVAIAFAKEDPDGNGKDDTYGLVLGEKGYPFYHFGTYWDADAWYHKNDNGEYIPGVISEARKQSIETMAELYKEGAIQKEFILLKPNEANTKVFYAGKAGIFIGSPRGMAEDYMKALKKIDSKAELAAIPPFEAPDGSRGYTSGSGYYTVNTLSAKLADDPGKVRRILEMIDFGRKFYPLEERTPQNKDFDWLYGHEGKGYEMADGNAIPESGTKGLAPWHYLLDNKMWAPNDEANEYSKTYKDPTLKNLVKDLEKMHTEIEHYNNPVHQVFSPTLVNKGREITDRLLNEQAKMITGDRPLSDWDQVVQEYLKDGGAQMIEEVNRGIKEKNIQPGW
ncbi:carbohydrate ABC transporter substrate-binding protein (CUT1 family) [Melghirimyces profundicolus]|uniref:Carbohydrate ABC transporter substrate-binding protein (CUT1 family) n=1 Tax=Melghirimyces profundicolus TaxID=1242148 RepID=A0A2T6C9C7_9BACL|nr:extracellular solute-binding protein [Melghirimyces profundicolus]PTX64901.1 carbohydrate ABC transporter substrate-binding protein (CUT1 family) [Melghirimyces profundicolus]